MNRCWNTFSIKILNTAFNELNLDYVFAGAKVDNIFSQKAQEKYLILPYLLDNDFPEEHEF